MRYGAICIVALSALGGCAQTITVAYHSDPEGATLYERGQVKGVTPLALEYAASEAFKHGGCQDYLGLTAKWVSGASTSIPSIKLCGSVGWSQQYTFSRPDVAGREVDVGYAIQLEQTRIMQQQARAANAAATAQILRAMQPPPVESSPNVSCTTRVIGNTAYSNCH